MLRINREIYLNQLINKQKNLLVKIITGMRRSKKLLLLVPIFKEYLISKCINENHIIKIDFDKRRNKKYKNPDVLDEYINCNYNFSSKITIYNLPNLRFILSQTCGLMGKVYYIYEAKLWKKVLNYYYHCRLHCKLHLPYYYQIVVLIIFMASIQVKVVQILKKKFFKKYEKLPKGTAVICVGYLT